MEKLRRDARLQARRLKMSRWYKVLGAAALCLGLTASVGCQTWYGGMTLPSGHYLEHHPQYFRPDPDFPLEKELATQQGQAALIDNPGRAVEAPELDPYSLGKASNDETTTARGWAHGSAGSVRLSFFPAHLAGTRRK